MNIDADLCSSFVCAVDYVCFVHVMYLGQQHTSLFNYAHNGLEDPVSQILHITTERIITII